MIYSRPGRIMMVLLLTLMSFCSLAQINSYPINQTIITAGQITLDIDNNGNDDFTFEIIDLGQGLLAARVITLGSSKMLDNSTFGYPDALNLNDSVKGYFNTGFGVLGTFTNAGQFNGVGNKYLGIKIQSGNSTFLGWIKLNCSYSRDTLDIISCGYNTISGDPILAGQVNPTGINTVQTTSSSYTIYPNPASTHLILNSAAVEEYHLINSLGEIVQEGSSIGIIDISSLPNGIYSVKFGSSMRSTKFIINR